MSDATVDELKIRVEVEDDKNGIKSLTGLKSTLQSLKTITDKGLGINKDGVSKIQELANSLKDLDGLKSVKISAALPKQIVNLGAAIDLLKDVDFSKVTEMSTALGTLGNIGQVNVPHFDNTQTNIPTEPATTPTANATESVVVPPVTDVEEVADAVDNVNSRLTDNRSVWASISGVAKTAMGSIWKDLNTIAHGSHTTFGIMKSTAQVAFGHIKSVAEKYAPNVSSAFSKASSFVSTAISKSATYAKNRLNELKSVGDKISKFFNSKFGKFITKPFTKFGNTIKSTTGKVSQFMSSIGRIALYRAVRSAIKAITQAFSDGINNLYQYSKAFDGTFAKSMDSISTSMQYFKNSIGAAVAPIINSLAPAIDFAVDKIVEFINVINQLFASLSGAKTWTKAVKTPKEYAASADKATKANDKLKKSILGIDEINPLQDNSKSGSGGSGSSTPDYSSMFTEVNSINGDIADFADSLKKAFNEGDWEGLGKLAADKVNETFAGINWNGIGHKIGYYINGAISTAYSFLHFTDFEAIGSDIAEVINGSLSEINFDNLGRLLVRSLTSVFDTVIGFATTLDWGQVGKSVGDTLKGSFNEISEWFDSKDWGDIISTIWKGLQDALKQSDPKGIAESFSNALKSALKGITGMLSGADFGDMGLSIYEWISQAISGIDTLGIAKQLAGLLVTALAKLPGLLIALNPVTRISAVMSGFFHSIGADGIAGFFDGILEKMRKLNDWVKTNITDPIVNAVKKWLEIGSPSKVFARIGKWCIEGMLNGLKSVWNKISSWFSSSFSKIKTTATNTWDDIKSSTSTKWNNIKTTLSNTMSGIKSNISNTFSSVTNTVSTAWSNIKAKLTPMGTKIGESIGGALKKAVNAVLSTVERVLNSPINAINSLLNTINKVPGIKISKLNTLSLPRLEDGGTLNKGQMFIANEAGPELVGNVGRRTTVMNNDDIVQSVSQGVADANTEQNGLLRDLITIGYALLDKPNNTVITTSQVVDGLSRMNRRTGQTVVPVGGR